MRFLALLLSVVSVYANAQVTIGSRHATNKGALLELKETNETNGGANSTKGLLLPRVYLSSLTSLIDLGIDDNNYPKPEYAGMFVYNVTEKLFKFF